jgi:hypothetical protein
MSLKVVKKLKLTVAATLQKLSQLVRCKIATDNLMRQRISKRQMGPERPISSASPGTFRTTGVRQKCPVTTIIASQSD